MNRQNKQEKNISEIKDGHKIIALIFSKKISVDGVKFLTPTHYPLQIGLLEHKNGKFVAAHRHRDLKYRVNTTQECLFIQRGTIKVTVFNNKWKELSRIKLTSGDFILFVSGGHSVNLEKNSRVVEVKQGPYPGDKKAKILQ